MAGEYVIQWTHDLNGTNPTKPRFTIQPLEVNGPGRTNSNTPLQIPGRYVVNYGELIAENFVHLLENFSGPTPPVNPTPGMVWFDTTIGANGSLKVRDKTNSKWVVAGSGGGTFEQPPLVGGAGSSTADFVATVGSLYFINTTTRAVTVTLPVSTSLAPGDMITFIDEAGTFHTNSLFINGNGARIMGLLEPMENDVRYSSFRLVYSGSATHGWRLA